MNILFTVEFYSPHVGGAEEVVRQLAERLGSRGHVVTVATTALPGRKKTIIAGVKIEEFALRGNAAEGIRGDVTEIARYRELLMNDFDIVVQYAAQTWTTDLASPLLAHIRAKKILVPCGYSGLASSRYIKYFAELPRYLKEYDALVYMSSHYQDFRFGVDHGLGHLAQIIPNGAAEEEFLTSDMLHIKEKLDIQARYLIITVANHYQGKGHRFIISAFRKMKRKDAALLIIGSPFVSSGMRKLFHFAFDYLYCMINAAFSSRIYLDSGRDRNRVLSAYKNASLFFLGSRLECAPLVMYEAFAAKVPFLARPVGNVRDYSSCIIIADTPRAMADAGNALLNDTARRNAMIEEAFMVWKSEHTWSRIVEQYESLFSHLRGVVA